MRLISSDVLRSLPVNRGEETSATLVYFLSKDSANCPLAAPDAGLMYVALDYAPLSCCLPHTNADADKTREFVVCIII